MTEEDRQRYSRHLLIREIGDEGVAKIRNGRVLVVGCGGLGSPAALYLAAAGVGVIGLIDGDMVEISNLQRQVIHTTPRLGMPKVDSAREQLYALNPYVKINTYHQLLSLYNAAEIMSEYDFILECTDNYEAKFLINDACVALRKPFSHGSVLRFEGQSLTYVPGAACYRCVYETPPPAGITPTAAEVGVVGSVAGFIGTIQATEALKFLSGVGKLLVNSLFVADMLSMNFYTLQVNPCPTCLACGAVNK